MATKAKWKDLLASKDLGNALPLVLQSLELELAARRSGSETSLVSLAQAVGNILSQAQVSNPSRSLLAASALLAALDLHFPKDVEVALVNDAVVKSVVISSTSTWPLVSALCIRALCSLVLASQKHQLSKEDRVEKQGWIRKVVPHIKSALEAHPKSFHVQQAVAEGCCALLLDGAHGFGGQVASLWPLLWPLVVHPKQEIAQPTSLALCRMTWLARVSDAELPTAEKAVEMTCAELSQLFNQSVVPNLMGTPTVGAILQCIRLVNFLKILLLYSRSKPADLPARRDRKAADVDDTLAVLPLPKIMSIIELVLGSLLRETQIASRTTANDAAPNELLTLLQEILELACATVDVAGVSLLVFAAQIRRWLELLADQSPKTDGKHGVTVFKLIQRLEINSPAILLRQPLLSKLCQYCLDAMHHDAGMESGRTEVQLPISRKRKAEALREDASDHHVSSRLFSSACQALTRLIDSGASMLQPMIASICEQLVQTVWHGLPRTGSVSGKEIDKCLVYRRICRDPEAVLGVLNVIRVLHQPRLGSVPLAPSLTHAFAALVSALQQAFERHALGSDIEGMAVDSVRLRLREISDSLRFDRFGLQKVTEGVGIVWPGGPAVSSLSISTQQESSSVPEPATHVDEKAPDESAALSEQQPETMEVEQPEVATLPTEPVEPEGTFMDCEPHGLPDDQSLVAETDPIKAVVVETPQHLEAEVAEAAAPAGSVPEVTEEFFTPRNAVQEGTTEVQKDMAPEEVAEGTLNNEAPILLGTSVESGEVKGPMQLFSRRCLALWGLGKIYESIPIILHPCSGQEDLL